MNIAVGSAFRNAAHYVPRYLSQVSALRDLVKGKHKVRVIAVEGDSGDDTANALVRTASVFGVGLDLIRHHHGQGWFGSTECPSRMHHLSGVGNAILDGITNEDDVLVYVESDLLWDPYVVATLSECAANRWRDFDIVAPLVFAGQCFYDVWGFRGVDDERFGPFEPYHSTLHPHFWTEVHSVGSCLVMSANIPRGTDHKPQIRMRDGALVEFCTNARANGYRIGVNPTMRIHHP